MWSGVPIAKLLYAGIKTSALLMFFHRELLFLLSVALI